MAAAESVAGLYADLIAVEGVDVTYSDGTHSASFKALPGRASHDAQTQTFTVTSLEEADWFVLASDLVLNGAAVEPSVGDTLTAGGVTYTVGLPDLERHWDWVSQARIVYRVHTYKGPQA